MIETNPNGSNAGGRLSRAVLACVLLAACSSGCQRMSSMADSALSLVGGIFSRGGVKLAAKQKVDETQSYRILIESVMPVWGKDAAGQTGALLAMKIQTRNAAKEDDGWMRVEADIQEGRYEVDAKERPLRLAGQKFAFSYGPLRRIAKWRRIASIPTGLELLEIGPPKGRLKVGETWQMEVRQILLLQQEEITLKKLFTLSGSQELGGIECAKLQVQIPATSLTLSTGAKVEFSGSGEVWISRKDGTVLKANEIIEGQMQDEKLSSEAGRMAQAISLAGGAQAAAAPAPILTLSPTGEAQIAAKTETAAPVAAKPATPAPAPQPSVPVQAPPKAEAAPAKPKPAAVPEKKPIERLTFVSHATGDREIWSVAPDGEDKVCMTGFNYGHWNPVFFGEGEKMACISNRGRGVNAWLFDLLDGTVTQLTDFSEEGAGMAIGWACKGDRLMMLREGQLWSMDQNGFNMQSYSVRGAVVDFSSVPASDKAAAVINILNQRKIVVVEVLSGTVRELFEGDRVSWAPNGQKLAYRGADGLNVAQADGTDMKKIIKAKIADWPIVWDNSCTKIAMTVEEEGLLNVMVVRTDMASQTTKVTSKGGAAVAFSPAGDRIAYLKHGDLWVASIDGNVHKRITSDGTTSLPINWRKHIVP